MASLVEACVDQPESFIELDWSNPEVLKCLYESSKISLLHQYIYAMIAVEERHDLRKNYDIYEGSDKAVAEIEQDFKAYQVELSHYAEYRASCVDNEDSLGVSLFLKWVSSQEDKFELLWEKITDEVFHLLFANRAFLLRFNQSLARHLGSGSIGIPQEYLNAKGGIKRQNYFPVWVRRAIYYRDQGRCVLCQRDLTGLLNTEQNIHYDHIVPLNLWGTNDPSNLQLLCDDCNLHKSGNRVVTATRYYPWWGY